MMVDYLLSGGKWAGPRASMPWAGSLAIRFIVGIAPMVGLANIPAALIAAFIVDKCSAASKAGLEPSRSARFPVVNPFRSGQ